MEAIPQDFKIIIVFVVFFAGLLAYVLLKNYFFVILIFVLFLIVASAIGYFIYKMFIKGKINQGHNFVFAFLIIGIIMVPNFADAQANAPILNRMDQEDLDNLEASIKGHVTAECSKASSQIETLNNSLIESGELESNNPYFELLIPILIVQGISMFIIILYMRMSRS